MTSSPLSEPESAFARWLPPTAIVVLAAPCLFLAYLPMTDLPQHLAVMSILKNLGDPTFAFDAYYEAAPDRILYLRHRARTSEDRSARNCDANRRLPIRDRTAARHPQGLLPQLGTGAGPSPRHMRTSTSTPTFRLGAVA